MKKWINWKLHTIRKAVFRARLRRAKKLLDKAIKSKTYIGRNKNSYIVLCSNPEVQDEEFRSIINGKPDELARMIERVIMSHPALLASLEKQVDNEEIKED